MSLTLALSDLYGFPFEVTSLCKTSMENDSDAAFQKPTKYRFKNRSEEETKSILKGKDKTSTQRATDIYLRQFKRFLHVKSLPQVEDIATSDLDGILFEFYSSIQPQKKEDYCVQTLKCIHAGLNRYFRKERGIDIAKDTMFTCANEMLKAVQVDAKKKGLGSKKKYPPINQIDLERIAEYFCHDHVTNPDPKHLKQNIIFYIIYFFCRRGRENLYDMQKNTYQVVVEPDGTEYVVQAVDEMDKNHGIEDTEFSNRGRMYATNGQFSYLILPNCNKKLRTETERK